MPGTYIQYPQTTSSGSSGGGGSGVTAVGTIDSQAPSSNAAVISGTTLFMQSVSSATPGVVSSANQAFAGLKTFLVAPQFISLSPNAVLMTDASSNVVVGSVSGGSGLSGSVSLTSQVSGVLPVTNGGTGVGSTFQQGSIVFVDPTGKYTEDNPDLFYSISSAAVGLGTKNLTAALTINPSNALVNGVVNQNRTAGITIQATGFSAVDATTATGTVSAYTSVNTGNISQAFTAAPITINNYANTTIGGVRADTNAIANNAYALNVPTFTASSGTGIAVSAYGLSVDTPTGAQNNYAAIFPGNGRVGIGTNAPPSTLHLGSSVSGSSSNNYGLAFTVAPSTVIDANSGSGLTQITVSQFNQPTVATPIAFSQITNAATVKINGPPAPGTNTRISNSYGLQIAAGTVNGSSNLNYGLFVAAPTGGTQNFAAQFSGRVAINTTIPFVSLHVVGTSRSDQFVSPNLCINSLSFTLSSTSVPYSLNYPGVPGTTNQALTASSGSSILNWTTILTNPMTTSGDIIVGSGSGIAARLAGNASGSTSFLSQVGNGTTPNLPTWQVLKPPTVQSFLTVGSSTYTTPTGVLYLKVQVQAPGGGGTGSSSNGGNGGNVTVGTGTSFITCNGGSGGGGGGTTGGSGGTANVTSSASLIAIVAVSGGDGSSADNITGVAGGTGGASFFGGGGRGGAANGAGNSAQLFGAGGGGAGAVGAGAGAPGGGAGGYAEVLIYQPLPRYAITIGAQGAAGTGTTGGLGGVGTVIVTEYYQ